MSRRSTAVLCTISIMINGVAFGLLLVGIDVFPSTLFAALSGAVFAVSVFDLLRVSG